MWTIFLIFSEFSLLDELVQVICSLQHDRPFVASIPSWKISGNMLLGGLLLNALNRA
jgi:hypothetical protein